MKRTHVRNADVADAAELCVYFDPAVVALGDVHEIIIAAVCGCEGTEAT